MYLLGMRRLRHIYSMLNNLDQMEELTPSKTYQSILLDIQVVVSKLLKKLSVD